jgi:CBS domain-containing protein
MNKLTALCRGAAAGAGLMYFFDPRQGPRRRALMRDAFVRLSNDTAHAIDVTSRDLRNRWHGLKAELSGCVSRDPGQADDQQLIARIRTHLGRVCSHPRAIEVDAHNGRVVLRGPVLSSEAQRVFNGVRGVRGVAHVENQMQQHAQAGNVSALQGGSQRPGSQWDLMQERWSPATRLLAGAGAASLLACASGRGLLTGTLGAIGLGMISGNNPLLGNQNRRNHRRQNNAGRAGSLNRPLAARRERAFGGISGDIDAESAEERESMKVSNIMTPSPATCHRDTKLSEVARLMHQCDCGAIPVVDEGTNHPIGVITDRDITIRAVAEGRNPLDLTAGQCMTSPVETISCEASLDQCTDQMETSQVRRMIVVDQDGKVCGIVAQADIAMYAPEEEIGELVHDVSTPTPTPTI